MKNIMLTIFFLSSITVFSQPIGGWSWDWEFDNVALQPITYTPKENVNEINYTVQKKNGKLVKYHKKFNADGKLLTYSTYDKKGNKIPIIVNEYDTNNWVIASKYYRKGKLKSQLSKSRLEINKPLLVVKKNAKNKVIYQRKWEYNSNNCVTKSLQYKKGDKLYRVWEFEYFDGCERSKSTLLNGDGEVVFTWNYDCKEEGEKETTKKNEYKICRYEESSKEYLIKINETTNEKGEVTRSIQKYTLTDTLLVESKSLDAEGRIVFISTFDKGFKRPLISKRYHKGKLKYWYEYTYENGNVVSQIIHFKDIIRSTYIFRYEDDKLVERKQFNQKDKLMKTITLSYS